MLKFSKVGVHPPVEGEMPVGTAIGIRRDLVDQRSRYYKFWNAGSRSGDSTACRNPPGLGMSSLGAEVAGSAVSMLEIF